MSAFESPRSPRVLAWIGFAVACAVSLIALRPQDEPFVMREGDAAPPAATLIEQPAMAQGVLREQVTAVGSPGVRSFARVTANTVAVNLMGADDQLTRNLSQWVGPQGRVLVAGRARDVPIGGASNVDAIANLQTLAAASVDVVFASAKDLATGDADGRRERLTALQQALQVGGALVVFLDTPPHGAAHQVVNDDLEALRTDAERVGLLLETSAPLAGAGGPRQGFRFVRVGALL